MAFRSKDESDARAAARLPGEVADARAEEARRSDLSRKRVVVTLDEAPTVRSTASGDRVVAFRGREDGRSSSLSAVYFVPEHERRGSFGFDGHEARLDALGAGDRLSMAGGWAKRRWRDGAGAEREAWEFRAARFAAGDVSTDAMSAAAVSRIDAAAASAGLGETALRVQPTPEFLSDFGLDSAADDARARQRAPSGGVAAARGSGPSGAWTEERLLEAIPGLLAATRGYAPYAGIGWRETPADVLADMTAIARVSEARGLTGRSGAAGGADTAFEKGAMERGDRFEQILPWRSFDKRTPAEIGRRAQPMMMDRGIEARARAIAERFHPAWNERRADGTPVLSDGAKSLHTRNVPQIHGIRLDSPSRFVMCYTADGKASGGTGQAIRMADDAGVPVLNLHNPRIRSAVLAELGLSRERDLEADRAVADAARAAREALGDGRAAAPAREAPASAFEPPRPLPGAVVDPSAKPFVLAAPAERFVADADAVPFSKVREANGVFSNMHNGSRFEWGGVEWTSEALYQAGRFPHRPDVQRMIWAEPHAYAAKTKAYEFIDETRADWSEVKDAHMAFVVTRRLAAPEFAAAVEAARGRHVVEVRAADPYWGMRRVDGGFRGRGQLGNLLDQLADGARMDEPPPGTTFPSAEYMRTGREAAPASVAEVSAPAPSDSTPKPASVGAGPSPRAVSYEPGNIVDHPADVLVNTVNCRLSERGRGVMGRGVALAFRERFPTIMRDYEAAIRSGELRPGRALLFDLPDGRKWAALATKDDFRNPSREEWVEAGLKELGEKVRAAGLKTVAVPPPGCGNGGLDWRAVEPLVHRHLHGLDVAIHGRPSGAVLAAGVASEREAAPWTPGPPAIRASMYFGYGADSRPEVASATTFDAILAGERTSTTRFEKWGPLDRYRALSVGDTARFFDDREMRGRHVDVVVLGTREVDLASASRDRLEEWSRAEGWTAEHGRESGRRNGRGVQILYDLPANVDAARVERARAEQRDHDAGRASTAPSPAPAVDPTVAAMRRQRAAAAGMAMG